MAFDYEFTKNLALVVIPTLIGVVGTNFLVYSWQIKKEKFTLRKEILTSFHDSFWKSNAVLYTLFLKISHKYAKSSRGASMDDFAIEADWKYPTKDEDKPDVLFLEEFMVLIDKSIEITQTTQQFDAMIDLYFVEVGIMHEQIGSLLDSLENTTQELELLVQAQNLNEMEQSAVLLIEHHKKNIGKLMTLDVLLMNEKLKTPKESLFNFSFRKKQISNK